MSQSSDHESKPALRSYSQKLRGDPPTPWEKSQTENLRLSEYIIDLEERIANLENTITKLTSTDKFGPTQEESKVST